MRRGHHGNVGWRSDNPRHFRPRSGGNQHFRGPRPFGIVDSPRFPPPGPRFQGPRYGNQHEDNPEQHDRSYRGNRHNTHRPPDRNQYPQMGQRQIFPLLHRMRHDAPHNIPYNESTNYYENNQSQPLINSMGDMDHRQLANPPPEPEPYTRRPWVTATYTDDRSPVKGYRHQDNEHNKQPVADFAGSGHRPPASDHYGGTHGSTMDNSNTFSRSVDDTVSIVRKRLLSRESQNSSETHMNQSEIEKSREPIMPYSNPQQELPVKKKQNNSNRIKNIRSNCDKIKNKIVHQLFMMDKDKIHKLMDNPNSSSKFEYAMSSLITESQNSYNRHLRSAAEKSLGSTSTELHNDTNNIYEDTFMKQMQCVLEPQDTVFLEDIKPIVLAELCKALQLGDLDQRQDEESLFPRDNQSQYNQYPNEPYDYDNNYQNCPSFSPSEDRYYEQTHYPRTPTPTFEDPTFGSKKEEPLFERRNSRKSKDDGNSRRSSTERRRKERRSAENKHEDTYKRCPTPALFEGNAEHLSDDEDPFAELDKQYHVAVDHNFIESYDLSSPQRTVKSRPQSPAVRKESSSKVSNSEKPRLTLNYPTINLGDKSPDLTELHKIKEELNSELQDMARSPLKYSPPDNTKYKSEPETPVKQSDLKQELLTPVKQTESNENKSSDTVFDEEKTPEPKAVETVSMKSESSSLIKSSTLSQSRKRSIDQRPSHRKEKRKKSECSPPDTNKQILNKNIIINVNDCTAKSSEKCDAPKSVFNLFFSKEKSNKDSTKDSKKVDSVHADKNAKRKEDRTSKKSKDGKDKEKEKESDKKKHDSSSSSNSMLSPSDSSSVQQNPTKTDKTKLKPIDMFVELNRRPSAHQAHRNTATAPVATPKSILETKPIVISRKQIKKPLVAQMTKGVSKETQTTVSKASSSRFCQTERKKLITRGSQTEPVTFKTNSKSTDTFERMKEIDMEIQALLQEKFKLYNSLESKESCSNTMQSLGMAVLNVATDPEDTSSISEDTIVDDFANMEELEEIALETVKVKSKNRPAKKSRRLPPRAKKVNRKSVQSPIDSKKTNTPNISLIEQIITDDRPLEEIISLDDLEKSPSKSKKKSHKAQKPKKKTSNKKVKVKQIRSAKYVYDIKDCSVVLIRKDLEAMLRKLKNKKKLETVIELPDEIEASQASEKADIVVDPDISEVPETMLDETVLNDVQFDMLDVSEDIVIGDVCEVKSEEKDVSNVICEEIILDNSQSSMDEAAGSSVGDLEECRTYDYSADENLRRDCSIVSGNGDAVLAIECMDDQFLAACLDGNVYHFGGDGQLINTLRGSNLAVTCLTIVKEKYGTTVYTGSLDSRIRYYDLETGLEKGPECNVLSPIQTMDRAWDTVFVGTRTGFVLQFECKNNMLIPISTIKFSEQCILALRAMKEGPRKVLLVAARSEAVTIKDAQTGLLLRTLEGPKMTVYTLLYEDGKVHCGTSGHQIHVFDYASGSHIYSHESGKGVVCLRALGGLLLAGCYDGCVYVYRDGEPRAIAQLRGPSLMLLSLAVLGTKIIAGYKDRSLYIWKIPLGLIKEMIL